MNAYFALAGGLAILLGLGHSVLGELLLIGRLTRACLPPLAGSTDLALRTLRFTWHLASVFCWCIGAILLRLSLPASPDSQLAFVQSATTLSLFASVLIVVVISRGKHPGWVVLLAIAILTWLG